MSRILSLKIETFRNLSAVDIKAAQHFNLFFGQNGAGKTSVLEAIYYLGVGRSFRTHLTPRLIQNDTESLSVFAYIDEGKEPVPLGVQRFSDGNRQLRMDSERINSWSSLAKRLPLCVLSAMSHRFLLDGPKIRRQFLDWLLFHVEQPFLPTWQNFQRTLKQRNAALKAQLGREQIIFWHESLIKSAREIDTMRRHIIKQFNPIFAQILSQFLPEYQLELNYHCGWDEESGLEQHLERNFYRDCQLGYTQAGPHRADLQVFLDNLPAQDILSQGQQKLVTYALHLAHGIMLKQVTTKAPVYLIDDLPAELDAEKRQRVVDLLVEMQTQVFITAITSQELSNMVQTDDHCQLFHVEQGTLQPKELGLLL